MNSAVCPLVVMTRACQYESRYQDPSCATFASCNIGEYHHHSIEASENAPATYDHALANVYGFGHSGGFYGKMPYIGPCTKRIFQKWIQFFKQYRETLSGELVHLSAPNGYRPDAVMHVAPGARPPALLVILNPTDTDMSVNVELPLDYAGFEAGYTARLEGLGSIRLDARAHGIASIDIRAGEILTIPITKD